MHLEFYCYAIEGLDSSVGIGADYMLDGPGIEFRRGRDFPHPFITALGSIQPPTERVPDLSRGLSGHGMTLTTHPI
jgi:hypothetical protein